MASASTKPIASHSSSGSASPAMPQLTGGMLIGAAMLLAAANFIAVLDTTIANVSVPNIAGALGATSSQGTYVITSYAVAEAITVPLTGWLAGRFGAVRVFVSAMVLFGLFSALCGLAPSLNMLVAFRIFQGLAGGPMIPLSQTLLLRIFPKEKASAAIGLLGTTTLVAPVLGPILGGVLCDHLGWSSVFLINVPVALACGYFAWQLLKKFETVLLKVKIDAIGMGLLVVWIAAMQIALDEGKDKDWFASPEIVALAIIAVIGFASFIIWELTEKHPVVDIRVFRHRGFSSGVVTLCLTFGAFFGATVLTPLWLQTYMGYTATWSGYTTAMTGVLAVVAAPFAAKLSGKFDGRWLVFFGVLWIGAITLWRTHATVEMTHWQIAFPLLLQGVGLPFFFMPLTGIALGSVDESEVASAAGLMSFCRTVAGAFATSLVNTGWENQTKVYHADLAGLTDPSGSYAQELVKSGMTPDVARGMIDQLATSQAVMLATNHIFTIAGLAFILAACAIWFAPKPAHAVDTSQAH